MLDIALLGTSGMMPLPNRFLTSMLCRIKGRLLIIDCGEGTQVALKNIGWGFKNIDVICFTHFHADHIAGLPGLLLTIGNAGRTEDIVIIGPEGVKEVVESLCIIAKELPFNIIFKEIDDLDNGKIKIKDFNIEALEVEHSMKCYAYNVILKRKGKFDVKKAIKLDIPKKIWSILQKENSIEYNNKIYTDDMVLGQERRGIKISYCTDTRPVETISDFIKNADLFICEGIYGENDKIKKAKQYKHMIYSEAATLAYNGKVSEMWLTHYSPSLTNPEEFLYIAQDIFPKSYCGYDGKISSFQFIEEENK